MKEILFAIIQGLPLTVLLTGVSFALGIGVALILILAQRTRIAPIGWIARILIDLLRGIPILVWLFLLYFGVKIGTFVFDPLPAALVVLGVTSGAHLAETGRVALEAVPPHQWESARALGLSRSDTFWRVLAPQAARIALPSVTTFALVLLKDTSIPSVIGVMDISFHTTQVARTTGSPLNAYLAAVVCYLIASIPLALVSRTLAPARQESEQ
ncbi:amino acid ABC transporter permease [Schaalia sp. ZJ405]|uniref:amino acid ABC transporter permease n=1 Tax=unclassified Schaalia TaxID=2691889 RepID=UPI0013ECDA48|nr:MULTISPECIES: amino acid ABC transporter permease [unclassified Schaalia]QPK80874.1 amino acid ABC transporter permease [Schaalia sp. ZJ405]